MRRAVPAAMGIRLPRLATPPDEADAYFAVETSSIDHHVLFYELDSSIEHARRADVLLLGNSRVHFALRPEFIDPEMERLGLRYFSLAMPFRERVAWSLELLRRHDLRPKVAVINVDRFFRDGLSDQARSVIEAGPWKARKASFEFAAGWEARRRLHALLPYFHWNPLTGRGRFLLYRSRVTGSWWIAAEPQLRIPFERPAPGTGRLPLAPATVEPLLEELRARGSAIVLTQIPSPGASPRALAWAAHKIGAPVVDPPVSGLATVDRSHLDRASAQRYSEAWMQIFEELPEVRALTGGSPPTPTR